MERDRAAAESAPRHRRREPDELPDELLEHVVGGLDPGAALARFEYFRRAIGEGDRSSSNRR